MDVTIGHPAEPLAADAYVRGERRRCIELDEFRGSWAVVAIAARTIDLFDLATYEDAFAGVGAVVLATTPDDYHDVEARLAHRPSVRFPVLTDVDEPRRMTLVVDPTGLVRWAGLRRSAREALAALEALVTEQIALCADCHRPLDAHRATSPLHLAA